MATDKQVFENTLTRIGYKMYYKEQLDIYESFIFILYSMSIYFAFCKWFEKWKKTN